MRKIYSAVFFFILIIPFSKAQTFQLFTEDFEGDIPAFTLNTSGPSDSAGNNKWIINNSYTGGFTYPNTTPQDSVVGGTIGFAPFSNYMHIYDVEGAPAITDANYNPANTSDNFTQMTSGFCTLGLVDIEFTYFWVGEGSPTAYGQVYYSADGGPWTAVGEPVYNNQHLWKYEVITDPAFENKEDLRFGFRWINDDAGGEKTISFGIDDIIVVGTYDAVASPVDINIDFFFPDPVCRLSTLIIGWSLSAPLCEGIYNIDLSDATGSFASPTDMGVFTIPALDTIGAIAITIPGTVPLGDCYKVRVNRVSPLPAITGEASVCFTVEDCPNIITTLAPVVTFDTNAVCVNSVIDVPFYSTGVYSPGNVYTAQLSDSLGNFTSPFTFGTFTSSATYDPALGSPPGTVSGIVPTVPPGCGYYIRVISSSPAATGSVYGPICIQDCDIETNDITDVYVCISEYVGDTLTITYDVNVFDSIESYCDTNTFLVQVLDPMFFSEVNLGGLGFTIDTASGTISLMIPGYYDLLALGLDAGVWYMRIIASCADPSENSLGTLIHLTIGAPADAPPVLIPADTLLCDGAVSYCTVVPYNPKSQYQFQFGTGTPFIWPYNPIYINFTGATGDVTLRVREINYGCPGPWSDYITIHVIDVPIVTISGPAIVCTGDTITYSVPYFLTTYYDWSISGGSIVDTSNNEIDVVWDSAGIYTLGIFALNECGSGTGTKTIQVQQTIPVNDIADITICNGQAATLNVSTPGVSTYLWYDDTSFVWGDFYFVSYPDSTVTYTVYAEDDEGCPSSASVTVNVEYPVSESDTVTFCIGTKTTLDAGHEGAVYSWSTGETTQMISVGAQGIYTVTIDPADTVCNITKTFDVQQVSAECDPLIHIPNAFSPNSDGVNDNLLIYGAAVTQFQIVIYNRWGEIVYQSNDISVLNNPDLGWNGKYNNREQEMGTYVYIVTVTGGSGKQIQKQGNITLIR